MKQNATIEKIVEQKLELHLQSIEMEYRAKFEEAVRSALPEPEDPETLKRAPKTRKTR